MSGDWGGPTLDLQRYAADVVFPPAPALYYDPRDAETAAAFQSLYADVARLSAAQFGLAMPLHLRVYVVRTWLQWLRRAGGWLAWFLLPIRLPQWWYMLSFCGGWQHLYAGAAIVSGARARIILKSLAELPRDLPPHLRPTWEGEPPSTIDRPTLWRREVVSTLLQTAGALPLPRWLLRGIILSVARSLVYNPPPPKRWRPILQWAGVEAAPLWDLREIEKLPQDALDELAGIHEWPYWVVQYLQVRAPGLLRELIAARLPAARLEHELAARLGMAGGTFWETLAAEVVRYYEGNLAEDVAPLPPSAQALSAPQANPYAAPQTHGLAMQLKRPKHAAAASSTSWRLVWLVLSVAAIVTAVKLLSNFVPPRADFYTFGIVLPLAVLATLWIVQVLYIVCRVLADLLRGKPPGGARPAAKHKAP